MIGRGAIKSITKTFSPYDFVSFQLMFARIIAHYNLLK